MKSTLIRLGLLAVMISALASCGGGKDGAPGAPGAAGAPGVSGNTQVASNMDPAQWTALTPTIDPASISITIASPPVVKFRVTDQYGNPLVGLGTKTGTNLNNVYFTLAKLVPVTGGPSVWRSYLVTKTATCGSTGAVADTNGACWVGTYPTQEREGTMVDNGDGSYSYTFARDIKQTQAIVNAIGQGATEGSANSKALGGVYHVADLDPGHLNFDASATTRLGIVIKGTQPGGTASIALPTNVTVDFRPDGGAITATRDIVERSSCDGCHAGKVIGHGDRRDPKLCVTCHTDQTKYGFPNVAETAAVPGVSPPVLTSAFYRTTVEEGDEAAFTYPRMIHKTHMGEELVKTGYNLNAHCNDPAGAGYNAANPVANRAQCFNTVLFPQDLRNCTKCHDGTAGAANQTPDGDNWKNVPSRIACGACHDGIDFATGSGITLADAAADIAAGNPAGTTQSGHGGGARSDSECSGCHSPTSMSLYHTPVTPPDPTNSILGGTNSYTNSAWLAATGANNNNLPTGAISVTYDIKSVARVADTSVTPTQYRPKMVFRMLQNGAAVPFNTYSAGVTTEIWNNFFGSPSIYFVFAVPQDGITAPADFNASASGYLRSLWNGTATGTGAGTLTGPDGSGYYTATLTGVNIPDNAVMLTGGLGYTYTLKTTPPLTQTNVPNYPITSSAYANNPSGGLIVAAPDAQVVASSGAGAGATTGAYSGRRAIVDGARCNNCHRQLGLFTSSSFHAGQRNDGSTCSWCHNPNQTNSGWSGDSTNHIHSIHAGLDPTGKGVTSNGMNKRVAPFTWHATSATQGFWDIGFPGVLKNCEACHLPGTYDFSASASASALPNRLYRTTATGALVAGSITIPSYTYLPELDAAIASGTSLGSGFSYNAASGVVTADAAQTTLVTSPIATACFACHDTELDVGHMESNGGSVYRARSEALGKQEQCMVCHATGRVADIKAMHQK